MTHPHRSCEPRSNRTRLLVGCGSAALALALVLAPHRASAQAVNGEASVTNGTVFFDTPSPEQLTVEVVTPTVVIDWDPFEDAGGNALDFLPTGNSLIFQSAQLQNFAVLNRILPATNGNIAVIDGNVISRIGNASAGFTPGGFVAFYSPTGILVGANATFDVGSLLLTTLDTTPASFENFFNGGNLTLQGAAGSTARIQISSGAQITALAENSFFAVVAADVEMLGSARINGSHAYVAGEVVNLQVSNGLFNITIPVGTAASGEVVTLNGDVGGPSSTGLGDNHLVYAVARASMDPISMLFDGNLGFDAAQSATIVNGEIILSANYDVFGRSVDTGSIDQGIAAEFRDVSATSDVRADIVLDGFRATSSVLAIGTGETIARGDSVVEGNLLLVGRIGALIDSNTSDNFTISGDVLVDARDYGVVSSSLQTLDAINATGGTARILATAGTLRIGGNVLVTADAFGGADDLNRIAGSAQGGLAEINLDGGNLEITGLATVSASGFGTNLDFIQTGAPARGGTARVTLNGGGSADFIQDLTIAAIGSGAESDLLNPSTVSDAFGGLALLSITGTGTITIGGNAILDASASARGANASTGGALADAGEASVSIDGSGAITIDGDLMLSANAIGGANGGGQGGLALGGAARAVTLNGSGTITVAGDFDAFARAEGGGGVSGGDAFGGIAGANAITGTIELQASGVADASALAGAAGFGFGGNGGIGRGGNAFFQADNGTSSAPAVLTIAGSAQVIANGTGGRGGDSNGIDVAAGRGGDGFGGDFATPNQADPAFGSGAFLLAGGDNGRLSIGGAALVVAQGTGGQGGSAAGQLAAGRGGNGFGGLAQAGLALLGGSGTVGSGSATFLGDLILNTSSIGGDGGTASNSDDPGAAGGDGTGGSAIVSVRAGEVMAGFVQLLADGTGGTGGTGNPGGVGTGGTAGLAGGSDGTFTATAFEAFARGQGGFAVIGAGGNAFGGTAAIEGDGITVTINGGAILDASATGGAPDDGAGGAAQGGTAYVAIASPDNTGTITITGHTQIFANGLGGNSRTDFSAGNGTGGTSYVESQGGGTITLGSVQLTAIGRGGRGDQWDGGNGRGGTAELRSNGTGSRLIIQRNVPSIFSLIDGGSALLNADGLGGETNGGSGEGGDARGGTIGVLARAGGSIALPTNPAADPNSAGPILLSARGIAGGSSVEQGIGGDASGGFGLIEADGVDSTIIMGETVFTVFAQGGSSLLSTNNINGGEAFGGRRSIRVINGGTATLTLVDGGSGTRGGDGSGAGNGGSVFAGSTVVDLNNGTLNVVGVLDLNELHRGGNGARGGDAFGDGEGGSVRFTATDSTINVTPDSNGLAGIALGGTFRGGDGESIGGNAFAGPVSFALTNAEILGGSLRITPLAQGGNVFGPAGQGGGAIGGNVAVDLFNATLNLTDDNLITANAEGGNAGLGAGSLGGSATSGSAIVTLDDSAITIVPGSTGDARLTIQSLAVSGDGAQAGDATARFARLEMFNSSLATAQLTVEAAAGALARMSTGLGGAARAGEAEVVIEGDSQLDVTDFLTLASNANTSVGGTAEGGLSALTVEAGSQAIVTAGDLSLIADGTGSDDPLGNVAGRFAVDMLGGNLTAGNLFASASGGVPSASLAASQLVAQGGDINVTGNLFASVEGNLLVQTGQGGIIGSAVNAASTTAIFLTAQGTIEIAGDNNAVVGLGGDSINLSAREIDILSGARIGADRVTISSRNLDVTAVLGGTTQGEGFTLTADELGRINAREFDFLAPTVGDGNDLNQVDLLIRELSLTGSASNGFARVGIFAGDDAANGNVRIEGTLSYINAGADDLLRMDADRIEIVTPGGIRITDANNAPGGTLELEARDIWVADAATIAQLRTDRSFAGRDALLAVAVTGSADPLGYIRAGGVTFNVRTSLLVRNTGTMFEGGGILVGDAGLSIISTGASQSGAGPQLDVIAYGRRQVSPGVFVTGEAFFDEVDFNVGSSFYTDASALNDCIITTGVCPQAPPPPPSGPEIEVPPQINNPEVFEKPIYIGDTPPSVADEDEERFGIDFPDRPEAPLITEDPLLDDPVTSGGDPSLYGGGALPPPAPPSPPLPGGQ